MQKPIEVSKTEDGTRLLRWFLRQFPGLPQRDFYKLCRGGQIRVNSSRCRGQEILRAGDVVRIPPTIGRYGRGNAGKKAEGGDKFSLADLEMLRKCIIHDDDDIVVFNKPAGLAVQGGTGIRRSVDKMAAALFPYAKISLVHRLDRETSGVLVVAKNHSAAQILSRQFQNKTARKEYLALLIGSVSPKAGVIDNHMVKGRIMGADEENPGGPRPQRAITEYKIVSELPGVLSWARFVPKTGRTHQLRVHSAFSLGAPIVGDALYGDGRKPGGALDSVLATKNLFLFAWRLSFQHPGTKKLTTVRAELPEFMKPVIGFLEFEMPE
jgi:23S rRNA pseudouridine955/2504/2580 synthase